MKKYIYAVKAQKKNSPSKVHHLMAEIDNPYYKMSLSYVSLCEDALQCAINYAKNLLKWGWEEVTITKEYTYEE